MIGLEKYPIFFELEEKRKKEVEKSRNYRKLNPDKWKQYGKKSKWKFDNRKHIRDYNNQWRENRRIILLNYLGGECVICGDKDFRHLQFDHINSDGKDEHGAKLVSYYINHLNEAKERLQILCANHNMEKKHTKAELRKSEGLYNQEIINNSMSEIKSERKYYIVNEYDREKPLAELIEMWESYTGWYWYITEIEAEGYDGVIGTNPDGTDITEFGHAAFGYVCGLDNEWGEIWMPDLHKQVYGKAKSPQTTVWKVEKEHWIGNSRVLTFDDEESFNKKVEELQQKYDARFGRDE